LITCRKNVLIIQYAVERKNRDAKDGVPVPIRQGLVNLYKLDKSYCAKHIAAEKGCSTS